MSIKDNLKYIKDSILECEIKNNRENGSVKLLAVSKFHPAEKIIEAINENQFYFGENRIQEACSKFESIKSDYQKVELHIIGQLQSNKVKNAIKIANVIQSVDRLSLINEVEKQCAKINKSIKILFEYHTAEDSKSGFENENDVFEILSLFEQKKFPHIIPTGFMTMAPFTDDEKLIHKSFETLRYLKENMQKQFPKFNLSELSMGMSDDYKIAIEEGSTMVRIGTAIFGERDYSKKV